MSKKATSAQIEAAAAALHALMPQPAMVAIVLRNSGLTPEEVDASTSTIRRAAAKLFVKER